MARMAWVFLSLLAAAITYKAYYLFTEGETTIEGPPPAGIAILPCSMEYADSVSISVGAAPDAKAAVARVRRGQPALMDRYSQLEGNINLDFAMAVASKASVKYRGAGEKYSRQGWYVTFTDTDDSVVGDFFVSDAGALMPVRRLCARAECCV